MLLGGGLFFALPAWADPHAVFFTDRAQAQVFYNVLAALNQSDYVENPNIPPIQSDRRFGRFLQTGIYTPPSPVTRIATRGSDGSIQVFPAPEPLEKSEVELPRVRFRQVTSDNGDVFYRERVERRALAEEMRVLLAEIACRGASAIYGETAARAQEFCPNRNDQVLPAPGV